MSRVPTTSTEFAQQTPTRQAERAGIIGWFARNHVAANLMMFAIIIGGLWSLQIVKKESFPEFRSNRIQIHVPYRGAAPEEVEKGVLLRLEEAVEPIEGIKEIRSTASEGGGTVTVELVEDVVLAEMMDKLKLAVDGISTFPAETERPQLSEAGFDIQVVNVQVAGNMDEAAMKELADTIREEIVALPNVSSAQVVGARPFEISIEIPEATLRQYGLTLEGVAHVVRQWSIDLPGGAIRSAAGDIRLRASGQAYTGQEYENIVLLARQDGTRIRLGDVATIRDGFVESASYAFFDGQRSLGINVMATAEENPIDVASAVRAYVQQRNATLPGGAQLTVWADTSVFLEGRLTMMLKNMGLGAILVLIILGVFLHLKIAVWVVVGMGVAFLGAFMLIPAPFINITVNIMSLFAFILVLGVVVDDAIIIAESAYAETERHGYTLASIVRGARRVAVPATFGVLTTIMAFLPMLFQTGRTAAFAGAIGWVVILCLAFSLVESKLILPSHLAIMRSAGGRGGRGVSAWAGAKLKRFIERVYAPLLARAVARFGTRFATLAVFISIAIATGGLVAGGQVRMDFFPNIPSDYLGAEISLQEGAPESLILSVVREMNESLREVDEELQAELGLETGVVRHIFAFIQDGRRGQFQVALTEGENREVDPKLVHRRWREKMGDIAGVQELRISDGTKMGGGPPLAFRLSGRDNGAIEAAAAALTEHLRSYAGLYEIENSAGSGPEELKLAIRPGAEALGVTLADLAGQVRQAFYGAEAQRIQRGESDLRVMVRYPRAERQSIGNLENMWIRLPDGRDVPFDEVATYRLEPGYDAIRRVNGRRTVTVSANADAATVDLGAVNRSVYRDFAPTMSARHPGVRMSAGSSWMEQQSSVMQMIQGFLIALGGIYVLLAVPLKSYVQPLAIMAVIPFGLVGAVLGHYVMDLMVMDLALSALSLLGFFAVAGVVVNDSLILVHHINRRMADGLDVVAAAIDAGRTRFRPVLLTSLTTFFGLVPIVFERSMQAQMVIPMAVSLAFGILFATVITLFLVPCLYAIQADVKAALINFVRWLRRRHHEELLDATAEAAGAVGGSALR